MQILRNLVFACLAVMISFGASVVQAKDIWPPPARFDSGALMNARFQTPIIKYLSPADLHAACRGKHLACAIAEVGYPCEIFLPRKGWERMLRHEMGHCRGWDGDHSK